MEESEGGEEGAIGGKGTTAAEGGEEAVVLKPSLSGKPFLTYQPLLQPGAGQQPTAGEGREGASHTAARPPTKSNAAPLSGIIASRTARAALLPRAAGLVRSRRRKTTFPVHAECGPSL